MIPLLVGVDADLPVDRRTARPQVTPRSRARGFRPASSSSERSSTSSSSASSPGRLLAAEPRLRAPIAAAGVILYALIGSLIGIDFAESTQPQFPFVDLRPARAHQPVARGDFVRDPARPVEQQSGKAPLAAAGVLVTAILMWGYMHAMQYIVIWAGDIPAEARWYIERGRHGWGALAWLLYGLQGLRLVRSAALAERTQQPTSDDGACRD